MESLLSSVSGGGCVLIIFLFTEMRSPAVVQAGLNVRVSCLSLPSAGITGTPRLILSRVGFVRLFKSLLKKGIYYHRCLTSLQTVM